MKKSHRLEYGDFLLDSNFSYAYPSVNIIKPLVNGKDVRKFHITSSGEYIILAKKGLDLSKYPLVLSHLEKYKEKLSNRSDKGETWYDFRSCSYYKQFEEPKIIYPDIALESRFSFDETGLIPNATLFMIPRNDKFLLAILNSSTSWFYLKNNCPVIGDISKRGRLRLKTVYLKNLPIPPASSKQKEELTRLVDSTLNIHKLLQKQSKRFLNRVSGTFDLLKKSNKLTLFYNYDFKTFVAELKKQKVTLSLIQQDEWEDYFNTYKTEINQLQTQITQTDQQIDQMVYELYGLTDEEIGIVEGS